MTALIAALLDLRERRRMQAVVELTLCDRCGVTLCSVTAIVT